MKDFRYTSVDRILDKLRRDLDMDDIAETDVIEWTGEALEAIGAITQYEDAIAFVEVKNYSCCIPNGTHQIKQIARNTCFGGAEADPFCPASVQADLAVVEEEGPSIVPVALDCNGSPINDYELAYYRPYFDLQAEASVFSASSIGQTCFTPIRNASHNFFNGVGSGEDIYSACQDEYQIVAQGEALKFSFEEGSVAISLVRSYLDANGYPMIPDHYSYVTAVTKYILYKLMEKRYYRNERGSESRLDKSERDWHWYCKQAGNYAMMPRGEDDHQDILEQRSQMIPKLRKYYGFFGKMNKVDSKKFNDPDGRNNYFRGI